MKVFLSYSFAHQAEADVLAKALRSLAEVSSVFLSSDTLVGGQKWLRTLQDEINKADAFVVLLGEHVGNWQRIEFADAFDRKISVDAVRKKRRKPPLPLVPLVFQENAPATLLRRDEDGLAFIQRLHLIIQPDAFVRSGEDMLLNPQTLNDLAKALQSVLPNHSSALWRTLNPYRGLKAMREQDADFLFGRDQDISQFISTLAEKSDKIVLALGASGVGKSSLVYAGVFAALERQALSAGNPWPIALKNSRLWPRMDLKPGTNPVLSLTRAFVRNWISPTLVEFDTQATEWCEKLIFGDSLDSLIFAADEAFAQKRGEPPPRYLLYVDQGEELYTRGGRMPHHDGTKYETDGEREARRFSEILAEAAAHKRISIIMSARSDFLGELQKDVVIHNSRELLEVEALDVDGFSVVIDEPANLLGVSFEDGLPDALVASTREQVGGLPLLSDTLNSLWIEMQHREDSTLRWSGTVGEEVSVASKLAERADAFFESHRSQEADIRKLFCIRLAHVPQQGIATRNTFYIDADDVTDVERNLISELADVDRRIVSTGDRDGRAFAEIAHESLFSAWERLSNWIEERRDFYAWATHITRERQDWEAAGRPSQGLLIGRPLERARNFLVRLGYGIPRTDANFVHTSISKNRRRKLALVSGTLSALVMLVGLSFVAFWKWGEADQLAARSVQAAAEAAQYAAELKSIKVQVNKNISRVELSTIVNNPSFALTRNNFSEGGRFELLAESGFVRVLEPFAFMDSSGHIWTAPVGAISDGLSIPRLFYSLVGEPLDSGFVRASIIHDYYSSTQTRDWRKTHRMLYEALLASGVNKTKASIFYTSILFFGPRWTLGSASG